MEKIGNTCEWTPDDDGIWETSCDNLFATIDGTPLENNFAFCPYCGKVLQENSATTSVAD